MLFNNVREYAWLSHSQSGVLSRCYLVMMRGDEGRGGGVGWISRKPNYNMKRAPSVEEQSGRRSAAATVSEGFNDIFDRQLKHSLLTGCCDRFS